jgi:hypothetical protein
VRRVDQHAVHVEDRTPERHDALQSLVDELSPPTA